MKKTLKVDTVKKQIIMDRTFAKFAKNTYSEEYAHLQQVRRDYPAFEVIVRTIKKNTAKKVYHGLTYDYMREYISSHGSESKRRFAKEQFEEMLLISKCQQKGKRYPTIKKWFLGMYPEIVQFGMTNHAPEPHEDEFEYEDTPIDVSMCDDESADEETEKMPDATANEAAS